MSYGNQSSSPLVKIVVAVCIIAGIFIVISSTDVGDKIGDKFDSLFFDAPKGAGDVTQDPVQTSASEEKTVKLDDGREAVIQYKKTYDISALVVGVKEYSGNSAFDLLCPVDAALAWGRLPQADSEIDFHWSQSDRWYHWTVKDTSLLTKYGGTSYVSHHSANHHLVPSDDETLKLVKNIKTGDKVRIQGYLVDIVSQTKNGKTTWKTSTSRTDTGAGACEIVYVTSVEWI